MPRAGVDQGVRCGRGVLRDHMVLPGIAQMRPTRAQGEEGPRSRSTSRHFFIFLSPIQSVSFQCGIARFPSHLTACSRLA